MSNPTPGEWIADLKFLDPRIMGEHAATGETFVIAKVISYIGAQDEANANALLFAASKKMYDALTALRQRYASVSESGAIQVAIDTELYNQIEAVIFQIEGQQPTRPLPQLSLKGKADETRTETVITADMFGPAFYCPLCQTTTLHRASPHDRYKVICRTCGDEHYNIPF